MTAVRDVLLLSMLCTLASFGPASAQGSGDSSGVIMPAAPAPAPVSLKGSSTALLILDLVDPICTREPRCMQNMLPAAKSLLGKARSAGVLVLYGTRGPTMSKWLPDVAPAGGETVFQSYAQDRFYNTELDKMLKDKGVTTLILMGWKVSGSVTYTSVGATLRGYTVVIPMDATAANTDHEAAAGIFQILNQADSNPSNQPLKTKASTLSRTDLITIQ